ncbi:MAG: hypothetical protein ACPG5B_08685 [Chitinophagales bacterium]
MKNLLIVLMTFATICFTQNTFAQNAKQAKQKAIQKTAKVKATETDREFITAEDRAQQYTNQLVEKLSLTKEQTSKIYNINLNAASQLDALRANRAGDRNFKRSLKSVQKDRDMKIKTVLNTTQSAKYQKMKADMKAMKANAK